MLETETAATLQSGLCNEHNVCSAWLLAAESGSIPVLGITRLGSANFIFLSYSSSMKWEMFDEISKVSSISHSLWHSAKLSKMPSNHVEKITSTSFKKNELTQPVCINKKTPKNRKTAFPTHTKTFSIIKTLKSTFSLMYHCTGLLIFSLAALGVSHLLLRSTLPCFLPRGGCQVRTTTQAFVLWLAGVFKEFIREWRQAECEVAMS